MVDTERSEGQKLFGEFMDSLDGEDLYSALEILAGKVAERISGKSADQREAEARLDSSEMCTDRLRYEVRQIIDDFLADGVESAFLTLRSEVLAK